MVIMVAEADNDENNIKWSVEVVFKSDCSLIFAQLLGDIGVGKLF